MAITKVVDKGFAKSYALSDEALDTIEGCGNGNLVLDEVSGDVICLDNGEVVGERVEYPWMNYNPNPYQYYVRGKGSQVVDTLHLDMNRVAGETAVKIIEMYREGKPVKEIARKLGVGMSTIYAVLHAHGLKRRKKTHSRRIRPKELKQIIEEIKAGKSIYEIARKYRRSTSTIHRIKEKLKKITI